MSKPNIAVIGAGVIGLSVAVRLQAEGHHVTIIAKDFPSPFETVDSRAAINYASQWAGAHNRFWPPRDDNDTLAVRDHAMSLTTFDRMDDIARRHPEAGITFMKGVEYLEDPAPEYRNLSTDRAAQLGYRDFRLYRPDELPDDRVKLGFEYRTWCVNPMVYCSYLLRRFVRSGGKAVRRELLHEREVFTIPELVEPARVVLNCSGCGFGDPNSFITRGQTCVVANECSETVTRQKADGSWTFVIPRNFDGGTIIGGTKEPDNWESEPSPAVRTRLLDAFAATYPPILRAGGGKMHVLRDIVGRRPTRKGGMRLEKEDLGDGRLIIHAYGLGGRGYELSWGVAEAVVDLLSSGRARL
ncbi:nucleotide-binding domain-containing protein [Sodiomyces alkalinus F11]|uniref:Nucleotide-binding domain-containing protein n=1 Tax=Sodiomyces alkalinus (strain CBS 110278 / VKM F-3762 / F11) TaxID=1314773 RepID=A0A3N2PYY4_SODAK|nr:nucleotide-binding domain-containing protein [Sodiomyces alkalinus F11]ROT39707.1 nucleotide-binding domain-containing protein [Sodiomyces alkalinus F11]